jgi:hypothetical protein
MKLKKVIFKENVRLIHAKSTRLATIDDPNGWGADYIELHDRTVIVHKNHESTCVPLENVTSFETVNEPAVDEFKKEAAKDEPQKRKQGERAVTKKQSKAKRKTSSIREI